MWKGSFQYDPAEIVAWAQCGKSMSQSLELRQGFKEGTNAVRPASMKKPQMTDNCQRPLELAEQRFTLQNDMGVQTAEALQ
jgi:hypothetical protein